jgi:ATP-dependent Lhr-like helicase
MEKQLELTRLTAVIHRIQSMTMHLVETGNLTPMAFPLWADRLSATLPAGDVATRLEAMLRTLNQAAGQS